MTNKQKGIICILISAFSFALMNLFVQLAGDINPIQKSFFRNLIAFLFAAAILFKEHDFSFQKKNLKYLILRSAWEQSGFYVIITLWDICFYPMLPCSESFPPLLFSSVPISF